MKLFPANHVRETEKYGFKSEFLTFHDEGFKGHMIGSVVALVNNVTGDIEKNYLNSELENRDELIKELIASDKVRLVTNEITQFDVSKKDLVTKTLYYLPYVPENFTTSKPTVLNDSISPNASENSHYEGEIEILLVLDEGYVRYVTMPFNTVNISMLSMVHDAFDDREAFEDAFGGEPNNFKWMPANAEYDEGYVIDFYKDCGEKLDLQLSLNELENAVTSVRITKLDCIIDN